MLIQNSERLSYRLMNRDDAELLFELDQDPEVMKYLTDSKRTSWEEIEDVYIPRMEQYTNLEKGWGLWMVSLLNDSTFIGWILVRPKDFFSEETEWDNLELGWRFKQDYWGKGFATEAARQVLEGLVSAGDCKKFSSLAIENNVASISVMKNLGMHFISKFVHHDPLWQEEVVYYEMDAS